MKTWRYCLAAGACFGLAAAAADASVFFTFNDPSTSLEVTYTEGTSTSNGTITYSTAPTVNLVVDGSQHGIGIVTYATTLTMNMTVGQASGFGGLFQAPVSGTFEFSVAGSPILTGVINQGALLTFSTTGSIVATSSTFSLTMLAQNALLLQLGLGGFTSLAPQYDASFSLSNLTPGPAGLNSAGYLRSFGANAAFVGNAEVIPSAGSTALAGLAALCMLPGRRRPRQSASLFRTVTAHV